MTDYYSRCGADDARTDIGEGILKCHSCKQVISGKVVFVRWDAVSCENCIPHPCCPDHPEAKHVLTTDYIRHPDMMGFPENWWVWSCQNMRAPFEGAPKMRCGYRHPISRYCASHQVFKRSS